MIVNKYRYLTCRKLQEKETKAESERMESTEETTYNTGNISIDSETDTDFG